VPATATFGSSEEARRRGGVPTTESEGMRLVEEGEEDEEALRKECCWSSRGVDASTPWMRRGTTAGAVAARMRLGAV